MVIINKEDQDKLMQAEKEADYNLKTQQPLSERDEVAAASAHTRILYEKLRTKMKLISDGNAGENPSKNR